MQLNTIELKGFASYRDYTKVSIPLGITGIIASIAGVEGKSNGGGKSSLLMTILYALYGTGTYDKTEEIWNDKLTLKDDVFVRINFSLLGNTYIVERGRANQTSYLEVHENEKKIGSSINESQDFINELLGMDDKLFLVSSFCSQGDLAAFIETEPKNRREYVDATLELEHWRVADRDCARDIKVYNNKVDSNKEDIRTLEIKVEENIIVINNTLIELQKLEKLEKDKIATEQELINLKNLDVTYANIKQYQGLIASLQKDIKDYLFTIKTSKERIDDLLAKITTTKSDLSSLTMTSEQLITQKIFDDERLLEEELASSEMDHILLQNAISGRAQMDAQITLLKSNQNDLSEGVCDRCKQTVTKEHISILKQELDQKLSKFTIEKDNYNITVTDLNVKVTNRGVLITETNKRLTELKNVLYKYNTLIEKLRDLNNEYLTINSSITKEISKCTDKIAENNIKVSQYEEKLIQEQAKLPKDIYKTASDITISLTHIQKEIQDLYVKKGRLEKVQEEQEILKSTLEDARKQLENSIKDVMFREILGNEFKNIPTNLFKESVGEIEEYANEIIQVILPKYRVKIYEDETKKNRPLMVAFEVDGKYRNYKLLSGGQKTICAIGLRLGFNRIIARRAKVSLNFLILDEILGSLDRVNREEVLGALQGLLSFFPQILLITHTEEAYVFPNIIHVYMDHNDVSHILQ